MHGPLKLTKHSAPCTSVREIRAQSLPLGTLTGNSSTESSSQAWPTLRPGQRCSRALTPGALVLSGNHPPRGPFPQAEPAKLHREEQKTTQDRKRSASPPVIAGLVEQDCGFKTKQTKNPQLAPTSLNLNSRQCTFASQMSPKRTKPQTCEATLPSAEGAGRQGEPGPPLGSAAWRWEKGVCFWNIHGPRTLGNMVTRPGDALIATYNSC